MANPERMAQLERALRNADAVGDTAAATALANEIRQQRGTLSPDGPNGWDSAPLPDQRQERPVSKISELRQRYPRYSDMSDEQFAGAFHKKFYSDMPQAEFNSKIGMGAEADKPITLNIGGKRVKVDKSFMQLSPEQQNATVDEIAASIGANQSETPAGKNWWDDAPLVKPAETVAQGPNQEWARQQADQIEAVRQP